jgi:5-methylcytosine-specific restriction endonuclease McrA
VKPPKPCVERIADGRGCPQYAVHGQERCESHRRPARVTPSGTVAQSTRWRRLRRELIDSSPRPLVCGICGYVIYDESKIELDHRTPVSAGGEPYDLANLQLTHQRCNRRKRNLVERKPHPGAARNRSPWMDTDSPAGPAAS